MNTDNRHALAARIAVDNPRDVRAGGSPAQVRTETHVDQKEATK